jgi:hypothetical protein
VFICEHRAVTSPPDPYSTDAYAVLDASILRDMADALDGRWDPDQESDPVRRGEMLAAARLRLYGERDRSGWYLVSYRDAREAALTRGDTDWSIGFIPDIDQFDDAPAPDELTALTRLYGSEKILPEAAMALAHAVLYVKVRLLITADIRPYRHSRDGDLPQRLELVTAVEAVDRLDLTSGEVPLHDPPPESPLSGQRPWWVP